MRGVTQPTVLTADQPTTSRQPSPMVLSGALVLRLVLILGCALAAPAIIRALDPAATDASIGLYGNAWVILVDVVTIAVVALLLRREGLRLGRLLSGSPADVGWGFLLFPIVAMAFFGASFLGNLVAYQGPPPMPGEMPSIPLWVGIAAFPAAVTIAIAEEALYRGYLQPRFEAWIGRWPGMLLVALVFGLQHIGFALGSPQAIVAKVITTFIAGIVFGLLYWWRRNLLPLVIAHALLDIVGLSIPTLMLAVG